MGTKIRMNIEFKNARILTMEQGRDIFEGSLYTENERIVYVGPALTDEEKKEKLPAGFEADRVIECEGNLLMPGFKNAHAHSGMSVLRSLADDMPLSDWLNKQIFPREAKLTTDMIADATKLSVLEYISGTNSDDASYGSFQSAIETVFRIAEKDRVVLAVDAAGDESAGEGFESHAAAQCRLIFKGEGYLHVVELVGELLTACLALSAFLGEVESSFEVEGCHVGESCAHDHAAHHARARLIAIKVGRVGVDRGESESEAHAAVGVASPVVVMSLGRRGVRASGIAASPVGVMLCLCRE